MKNDRRHVIKHVRVWKPGVAETRPVVQPSLDSEILRGVSEWGFRANASESRKIECFEFRLRGDR